MKMYIGVTTLRLQTGNFAWPEHACTMPRECTLRNNYYNAVDRDCAEEPASGNCTCFNGALRCFNIGACDTPAARPVKSFSHIDTAVPQSAIRTIEITRRRATRQSFAVFPSRMQTRARPRVTQTFRHECNEYSE